MTFRMGKIVCLIGRHRWRYAIAAGETQVIRFCVRCYNPKIADIFPVTWVRPRLAGAAPDRELPDLGSDGLRSAVALLRAMNVADIEAINVLARDVEDPLRFVLSQAYLTRDALAEPASDDMGGYVDRLFARLDRSPQ